MEHIQLREAFGACPLEKELRGEESTEKMPFALSEHQWIPVSPKGAVKSKKGTPSLRKCILSHSTRANKIIFWTQQEFIGRIIECSRFRISERDCLGLNQSSKLYYILVIWFGTNSLISLSISYFINTLEIIIAVCHRVIMRIKCEKSCEGSSKGIITYIFNTLHLNFIKITLVKFHS